MASTIQALISRIKTSPHTRMLTRVQPVGVRFAHSLTRTFLQVGGKPGASPARGHIPAAPRATFSSTPARKGSRGRETGSLSPPGGRAWSGRAAVGAALGVGTLVVGSSLHTGSLAAMALKVDLTSAEGDWKETKEFLLSLPASERRKHYRTNSVPLDDIPVWTPTAGVPEKSVYPRNDKLDQKISLYTGDITKLEIDAIVNAANQTLLGGGGVDGAIHRAAGPLLKKECATLHGCETGQAKITGGYALPAKYVIHTVGPIAQGGVGEEQQSALRSCYKKSLQMATENAARCVAFPCISTGIYGYPPEQAVHEALATVREYLDQHHDKHRPKSPPRESVDDFIVRARLQSLCSNADAITGCGLNIMYLATEGDEEN
ncbi:LOW QUALITY PROTEIN: ADP-ribose glycohydrolase MACROD1 [Neosynchiropus ocellatus]